MAVDLVWTGDVSSDASNTANWEPQQAITESDVLIIDSAYKFTNLPVFSGVDTILVNNLTMSKTAEITIDLNTEDGLFNVAAETPALNGIINIKTGILSVRRMEIRDTIGAINVYSGGTLRSIKYMFLSSGDNGSQGGYVNLFGTGKVLYTAAQANYWGRFPAPNPLISTGELTGVYTLDTLSTMQIKFNYADLVLARIDSGQVVAAAGYDVIVEYDAAGDWTYVSCRDKLAFVIEPTDNQFIITGQSGSKIGMVQNDGYAGTTAFNWQYSTTSGSGYVDFSPAVTTDSIEAVFDTPGIYYVVCVGDGSKTSNEVKFYVGSDKVLVSPGGQQFLREDMNGAMLTASVDAAITSQEWKWSMTPGEGHQSFSPAQTGLEFTPNFDTTGLFYVICEGTDAGSAKYPSKDVVIKVDNSDYIINWRGMNGNSASEASNWDPIANPDGNRVTVQAPDTYQDSCVFMGGNGNINISRIYIDDTLSTMSVDMGIDTLRVSRGSTYGIKGELIVSSGVLSYTDLRHAANGSTGRIIVKGTGEFLIRASYFMMGNSNTATRGGYIDIMDDGKFISIEQQPARWPADSTLSIITIAGNGMLQVPGDWRGGAETVMGTGQLRPGSELEQLVVTWPVVIGEDTVTRVTAKSLLVFEVEPLADQLVGVGEAVAELSTVNADDRTSVEWKHASASGGPYMSFSPAATGNKFSGSFDAAGTYYVVCEGYAADTVVSSEVMVQVVGVSIAPDADQALIVGTPGTALTVTETATADSREWKRSITSGSGYTAIVPPASGASYTPLFLGDGTFYVICASTFGTKTINSNEVKIVVDVDHTAVEDNFANGISMYPNPAQQAFFLDAGDYSSYKVKISDLTGRTVLNRQYENVVGPQMIELNRNGIYFVEISTDDAVHTAKMIIK
jgi:hypothetical protein